MRLSLCQYRTLLIAVPIRYILTLGVVISPTLFIFFKNFFNYPISFAFPYSFFNQFIYMLKNSVGDYDSKSHVFIIIVSFSVQILYMFCLIIPKYFILERTILNDIYFRIIYNLGIIRIWKYDCHLQLVTEAFLFFWSVCIFLSCFIVQASIPIMGWVWMVGMDILDFFPYLRKKVFSLLSLSMMWINCRGFFLEIFFPSGWGCPPFHSEFNGRLQHEWALSSVTCFSCITWYNHVLFFASFES